MKLLGICLMAPLILCILYKTVIAICDFFWQPYEEQVDFFITVFKVLIIAAAMLGGYLYVTNL